MYSGESVTRLLSPRSLKTSLRLSRRGLSVFTDIRFCRFRLHLLLLKQGGTGHGDGEFHAADASRSFTKQPPSADALAGPRYRNHASRNADAAAHADQHTNALTFGFPFT